MNKGGKREGAGRKKKPDHLRRDHISIRLPKWMLNQLRNRGEVGYQIEEQLLKANFLKLPDDYKIDT